MKNRTFLKIILFSIILFFTGNIAVWFALDARWVLATTFGYAVSLVNIVIMFFSIQWAFTKESKIFYSVLYGGMAFRFVTFGVPFYLIFIFTDLPIWGYLVSFIVFYVIFQYFEVQLINAQLKDRKSTNYVSNTD